MNSHTLNLELCRALGINDGNGVRKVVLTIEASKAPTVVVERFVRDADGLHTAVEMLNLTLTPMPVVSASIQGSGRLREELMAVIEIANKRESPV